MRSWGRIGNRGTSRTWHFESIEDAEAEMKRVAGRREEHGNTSVAEELGHTNMLARLEDPCKSKRDESPLKIENAVSCTTGGHFLASTSSLHHRMRKLVIGWALLSSVVRCLLDERGGRQG